MGRRNAEASETRELKEAREALNACLKHHIVDLEPGWYGDRTGRIGGDVRVAATASYIDRCVPPLEVPKLRIEGGKNVVMIGPNGAGKSTMLDAIMSRSHADFSKGSHGYNKGVHYKETLRIARLDQEELLGQIGDVEVGKVLELLENKFQSEFPLDWSDFDGDAYDQNLANQEAQLRIETLMSQTVDLFEIDLFRHRKVSELSGGEKTKLSLIMLLASEADVLLFDEPTNHLDLESIAKLIGLFESYKRDGVAVVSISHVEWFLEQAGRDGIIQLEMNADGERSATMVRSSYKDVKTGSRSRVMKGDVQWHHPTNTTPSNPFLATGQISIDQSPLKNVEFPTINPGGITMLSGKNGTGKTKFMEELANPRSKVVQRERGHQIAYLPQFWPEDVAHGTVKEFFTWVKGGVNSHSKTSSSRFLKELRDKGLGSGHGDVLKEPISTFSGGEQRLMWFLAASVLEGTDMLILDEPSNHMDEATMEKVLDAIRNFGGSVILSSHDLRLMQELERHGGPTREGRGVHNLVFERNGDTSTISASKKSPLEFAKGTIAHAKKTAKRVKV